MPLYKQYQKGCQINSTSSGCPGIDESGVCKAIATNKIYGGIYDLVSTFSLTPRLGGFSRTCEKGRYAQCMTAACYARRAFDGSPVTCAYRIDALRSLAQTRLIYAHSCFAFVRSPARLLSDLCHQRDVRCGRSLWDEPTLQTERWVPPEWRRWRGVSLRETSVSLGVRERASARPHLYLEFLLSNRETFQIFSPRVYDTMTQVTDSAYNALKIVLLASLQRSHAATLSELETIIDELEVTDPSARDLQQLLASINLDISSYGRSIAPSHSPLSVSLSLSLSLRLSS